MVSNLRWGIGAGVQGRHHFPSIDPHLCFEFLQFFLFIMDPCFKTFQIKITLSVRYLTGTNIYMAIFCQVFLTYIIYFVNDKMNNLFFSQILKSDPKKLRRKLNWIKMTAIALFEDTDHIYDWFDFINNLCL